MILLLSRHLALVAMVFVCCSIPSAPSASSISRPVALRTPTAGIPAGLGKTQLLRTRAAHDDNDVDMYEEGEEEEEEEEEEAGSSNWSEASDDDMRPPTPGPDVEIPGDYNTMVEALQGIWQGGECVRVRKGIHAHLLSDFVQVRHRGVVRIEADEGSEVWGLWWVRDAARVTARGLRACVHAYISEVRGYEMLCA